MKECKMYEVFGVQNYNTSEIMYDVASGNIPVAQSTLYLSENSVSAWVLIEEIINWTNRKFTKSNGHNDGIPISALQLYCASHYYYYIRGVGHNAFIKATYNKSDEIWPYVLAGFLNMGAIEYIEVFQQMVDWAARNIDDDSNIENSMAFTEELESLDYKFEALNLMNPYCEIATKWIKTWDNIEIIPDRLSDITPHVVNAA